MRRSLAHFLGSRGWEYFIIAVIVLNAITMGLETDAGLRAAIGGTLAVIDRIILAIFVVEIALRLFAFGFRFFRDPWSLFDFAIVAISLMPASGPFQVLRSLRILRVLRLISVVPSLRRVVGGLVAALPGMASIVVLLVLMFYVFAVMATGLYGASFPDWFGTLGASTYTLFQVMTLESWSMGIVRPVMEVYPYAWLFFIIFILLTTFAVLNLFIAIIVDAMAQEHHAEEGETRAALGGDHHEIIAEIRALKEEVAALRREGR